MKLLFVRHAESTANAENRYQGHADFPLSDAGRRQARKLAARFRDEGFEPTHVYTSPLSRTSQTAAILAARWPLDVVVLDDLIEHDVGALSGLTVDEAAAKYPELDMERAWETGLADIEGVELPAARMARARRVVDRAVGGHGDQDTVLMVTHGGILQHILAALLGTDRVWGTRIRNTGLFEFTIDKGRWALGGRARPVSDHQDHHRIDRFNDAAHLD